MDTTLYDKLIDSVELKRSNIKYKTVTGYVDTIKTLMNDMKTTDFNFLKDVSKVNGFLQHKPLGTYRKYIASIVVVLDSLYGDSQLVGEYRAIQCKLIEQYQENLLLQKKTEKQNTNWVSLDTLKNCMLLYENTLKNNNVFRKKFTSPEEKELLTNWLITALYVSDDNNPPRRLDYRNMKVIYNIKYNKLSDIQKSTSNYLVLDGNKKIFSFGDYKTSKKYGTQMIYVNNYLSRVLDKYLKNNDYYHLFPSNPSSCKFSKMIVRAFSPTDKKITVNLIRHIYITEKHPPQNQARIETAFKMGHSLSTNTSYSLS